jgi:hypothetical protein
MFTKKEFIQAYVISAVQGTATERGGVDVFVLALEAAEAFDEIEKGEAKLPTRGAKKVELSQD